MSWIDNRKSLSNNRWVNFLIGFFKWPQNTNMIFFRISLEMEMLSILDREYKFFN